ncbi:MAG: sigma 54-interacting transcriptional regulator [Myxococcota bacterium]
MEGGLIGASAAMAAVRRQIERLADLPSTVLIVGETGTGKSLAARALHAAGRRARHPFVHTDCAGLPESLFESELFGHARGAYTGAVGARPGRVERAGEGTLFLDEIGELPLRLQAKLLRLLHERCFERLGSATPRPFRGRIVAATNRDLGAAVRTGRFRRDLWFRLDVLRLELPPLREHLEDLPALAAALLARIATRLGLPCPPLEPHFLADLAAHDWPGNVRELENALERWLITGDRGREVA